MTVLVFLLLMFLTFAADFKVKKEFSTLAAFFQIYDFDAFLTADIVCEGRPGRRMAFIPT